MRRSSEDIAEFIRVYRSQLSEFPTNREAYDHAEELHIRRHGRRFYKNYDSFRACQSYHIGRRSSLLLLRAGTE